MNLGEKKSKKTWKYARIGLLIFPFLPTWGALILLLATIIAWKKNSSQIIRKPINIALAILSIWLIFIAIFASDRLEAFLGLANFLPFFLFFAAFNTIIKTTKQLREFSWVMAIASVPISILGFAQKFFNLSTPPQLQFLLGWVLEAGGNPPSRMASVFMYANILGIYLAIVLILTLGLWLEEWQLFKSKFPQNPQFILLTLILLSNTIAIIFTHSRNAWGLVIFAVVAYGIYLNWYWLIGAVGLVVASVFGAAFGSPPGREWLRAIVPAYFWARLSDRDFPNRAIASLRSTQWQFAWNLTRERPLTGWGLRNFTPLYEAKMNYWLGHPHNLVLMLACETGIPATLFFCGWVGWILAQGVLLLVESPPAPLGKGGERAESPPAPLGKGGEGVESPPAPLRKGGERLESPPAPLRKGGEGVESTPAPRTNKNIFGKLPPFKGGRGGDKKRGDGKIPHSPPTTHPLNPESSPEQIKIYSDSSPLSKGGGGGINPLPNSPERLIFFSYLIAFGACTLFNMFDVTLFDLRINTISWLLLAAICGISCPEKAIASQET